MQSEPRQVYIKKKVLFLSIIIICQLVLAFFCSSECSCENAGLVALYFLGNLIRTNNAREPYILVIFQGGGGGPDTLLPPLDPRMNGVDTVVFPKKKNSRGEHPAALKLPPPALIFILI